MFTGCREQFPPASVRQAFRPSITTWGQIGSPAALARSDVEGSSGTRVERLRRSCAPPGIHAKNHPTIISRSSGCCSLVLQRCRSGRHPGSENPRRCEHRGRCCPDQCTNQNQAALRPAPSLSAARELSTYRPRRRYRRKVPPYSGPFIGGAILVHGLWGNPEDWRW